MDETNKEIRRQQVFRRLGMTNPRCVVCGEADYRCLEWHHLAAERFGEEGVVLCRNCHRKVSDDQRDHPAALSPGDPPVLERIGHFLLGLADLFELLMRQVREFGRLLIEAAGTCPPPYGLGGTA